MTASLILSLKCAINFFFFNSIPWKKSINTHQNHVKFEGLSTYIGYKFNVFSSNEQGLSREFSTIYVPIEKKSMFI